MPYIRFLFVRPRICRRLPSDSPHGGHPCLKLTIPTIKARSGLTPYSCCPCGANKVSAGQANYLRDLKLHESQEETECNEEYIIFTYYLRPTFDFQQELLWNGEDLEVLAPTWLRKELAEKIKRMYNKYNISE